jgi:hypothetical protein
MAKPSLAEIEGWAVNFDPVDLPKVATDPWHIDDYCTELPAEEPGEPEPGGSFEIAKELMTNYSFADPSMVRATWRKGAPLLGRSMLLEIRWFALRVHVAVRVSQIFDETREVDGRQVRIWGWAYQTLGDHLERGQMDYQVWKWLDTGRIEYRIHAVSVLDRIVNPVMNIGFRLIGRREQTLFARRCGERMTMLVEERLRKRD